MTEEGRIAQRLGREIQRRREARGMTLEDLSDLSSLTPVFIRRLESGQCDLSLSDLTAIALALGCDARDLCAVRDDVMVDNVPELDQGESLSKPRSQRN